MARPSRSKQPEFDPSEIDDLIFTPAVGRGVGSHLVREEGNTEQQTTVVERNLTTVAGSETTIVGQRPSSVGGWAPTPVDSLQGTSVVRPPEVAGTLELWRTDSGDVVPGARVRRIVDASDILGLAERAVYDLLWAEGEEAGGTRLAQAGYDAIMKRTDLSKKTVQRVIDRLLDKEFIAIEVPADIYHRTSTTYRIFDQRTALARLAEKGRLHSVKVGPGFVFAVRLQTSEIG